MLMMRLHPTYILCGVLIINRDYSWLRRFTFRLRFRLVCVFCKFFPLAPVRFSGGSSCLCIFSLWFWVSLSVPVPWIARKVLSPEVTKLCVETLMSLFFFQWVYCCYCDSWCMTWCCLHVKVLCKLSSLSEASVTRRSAGLPLIINTILASEARIKQVSYIFITSVHFVSAVVTVVFSLLSTVDIFCLANDLATVFKFC